MLYLGAYSPRKISDVLPVQERYPIAPKNNREAITFGKIPPMIFASPKIRKEITTKTLDQVSAKFIYLISPEKKKNQVKTIIFKARVREIAITLKVVPTSSVSGFSLILSIYPSCQKNYSTYIR